MSTPGLKSSNVSVRPAYLRVIVVVVVLWSTPDIPIRRCHVICCDISIVTVQYQPIVQEALLFDLIVDTGCTKSKKV